MEDSAGHLTDPECDRFHHHPSTLTDSDIHLAAAERVEKRQPRWAR